MQKKEKSFVKTNLLNNDRRPEDFPLIFADIMNMIGVDVNSISFISGTSQ